MSVVSPDFHDAWASGQQIGARRPVQRMWVRQGEFVHAYGAWAGPAIGARLSADAHLGTPYQATWTPAGPWIEVPGILEVVYEQDLADNGITSATITADNILRREQTGVAGIFHTLEKGGLAPFRGYEAPGRPDDGLTANEWSMMFASKLQVTIEQGYGDATIVETFTGMLDSVDMTSSPTRMTLTARDFGGPTLAEQRFFGSVKDPQIRQPVTFVDALGADDIYPRGHNAAAKSSNGAHTPGLVLDRDSGTYWQSSLRGSTAAVEWIDIEVPQGRYASFYVWPKWAGMNMKLSIYVAPRDDGRPCQWNGATIPSGAWLDLSVGTTDGVPYIAEWNALSGDPHYHQLGDPIVPPQPNEIKVGPGSKFRLTFTDLHDNGGGDFSAGVTRFVAMERIRQASAMRNHWILIDDAADIVRVVLRWAGFKEWEVENTGVRIKRPLVVNAGDFLMDVIRKVCETTGYTFFIKDPTGDDLSIGVPVFRKSAAWTDEAPNITLDDSSVVPVEVTDEDLLLGLQVKWDEAPLAYIIRVRGKQDDEDGHVLMGYGNGTKRISATFRPPWYTRLGGIFKHVVHTDDLYTSGQDCLLGCYIIALEEALESVKGSIEIPAHPGVTLDQMIGFRDEGTGSNTRMWISNRRVTMRSGQNASWKASIGGSMVDTPDVVAVKDLINTVVPDPE